MDETPVEAFSERISKIRLCRDSTFMPVDY
jgi:hypothetical protein